MALEARYRLPLTRSIDLDMRAGPYWWLTTSDVYVSGVDKLHRSDNGVGYTLGVGPRFAPRKTCRSRGEQPPPHW